MKQTKKSELLTFMSLDDYSKPRLKMCDTLSKMLVDHRQDAGVQLLAEMILSNPRKYIGVLRNLVGMSNDKLEEFIKDGIPNEPEAQALCCYNEWPKTKSGKQYQNMLENWNLRKAFGLASLFLSGVNLECSTRFPCLRYCDHSGIVTFLQCVSFYKKQIITDRVAGSWDAKTGTYRERFCKAVCSKLFTMLAQQVLIGPPFDYNELTKVGKILPKKRNITSKDLMGESFVGFDLILINNKGDITHAVEVAIQEGTGSGITRKSRDIARAVSNHRSKFPNTHFLFIWGGYGWYSRQSDLELMCKSLDGQFPFTITGLTDFLKLVAKDYGKEVPEEKVKEIVVSTYDEFCHVDKMAEYFGVKEEV